VRLGRERRRSMKNGRGESRVVKVKILQTLDHSKGRKEGRTEGGKKKGM